MFYLDTPTDRLSDAVFRYGRAMTRIYDLTLHSRSRTASTFYSDLADLILQTVDKEQSNGTTSFRTSRTLKPIRSITDWRARAAAKCFSTGFRIATRPA